MIDTTRAKLFISYARKDGRELAIQLQKSLSTTYDVWLDTSEIDGGASWGSAIEQAIDGCKTVVALLSAASYQSEICRAEQLRALRKGKRVIPLLVQANAERPIWLESLNYRDFSDELAYDTSLSQLLSDLTSGQYTAPAVRVAPNTAPSLPAHFVPRSEAINQLREAIISDATDRHVALTALHGMGGIGKSVMATALCYDAAVQDAFPDGIFWIEIGRKPSDLIEKIKVVGKALGDADSNYTSKDLAVSSLRQLLAKKSVLIVLDDVWDRAAIEPFLVNSPQSRWLVTTRDGYVATALGAAEIKLGTLTKDQALNLLRGWAGYEDAKHAEITEVLGYHPLAIKLVGARLKDGMSAQEWLDSYHSIAQIKLGRRPTHTDESLQLCFDVSLERLHSDDRSLYHALGIFPENEWIPESVVARLWCRLIPDLSASDCAEILIELDKLTLIDRDVVQHDVRMHDLLHNYNREALGEQYKTVQTAFIAAHPDLRALADAYTWRFIGYHLIQSGQVAVLRSLLLDYNYLRAKLGAVDTNALQDDCDLLLKSSKDESIWVLRSALSMSAHVLREDPSTLGHQLVGRMMGHRNANAELRAFTDAIPAQQPGMYPVDFDSEYVTHEQAGGYLLATLSGHTSGVWGAIVLKDGRILSWSDDATLRLWAADGTALAVLTGHTGGVGGALALADGRFLSWSDDATLRLWAADGTALAVLTGHTGGVGGALALADGRFLSWSDDCTLRLWTAGGILLTVLEGHKDIVFGAAVLSNGSFLSWAQEDILRLWADDGTPLAVLKGHTSLTVGAAVLSNGSFLSWAQENALRLWADDGTPLAVLKGHTNNVRGALALADGRFLSWSDDNTLRLWNGNGMPLAVLEGHMARVNGVQALADGRFLSWSDDQTLRLWTADGLPLLVLKGHNKGVGDALILTDGHFLSWSDTRSHLIDITSTNYMLRLWGGDGTPIAVLTGHTGWIYGALTLADGRFLSWSDDNTLRLWESDGAPLTVNAGHTNHVSGTLALTDGRCLSWGADTALHLWAGNGAPLTVLKGHTDIINGALPLPNGCYLSWSADTTLRLWATDGTPLAILRGHTDVVNGALALTDGRFLSWSWDGTLRLWTDSGALLSVLEGHDNLVLGVIVLPEGRFLSWGMDATLRLWSADGNQLAILKGHEKGVGGALFLNGHYLSWGWDNTLRVWTSDELSVPILEDYTSLINGALVLSDGRFLSWSTERALRLWPSSRQPTAYYRGLITYDEMMLALADGRLLSWQEDNILRLWTRDGILLGILKSAHREKIIIWASEQNFDPQELLNNHKNSAGHGLYKAGEKLIILYQAANGQTLSKFYADADITTDPIFLADGTTISIGDRVGRVLFLRWRDR